MVKKHFKQIATIDIGVKNSAIAFFDCAKIIDFALFSARSTVEIDHLLSKFCDRFKSIECVFIERQLGVNTKAVFIEGQFHMWFTIKFPSIKIERYQPRQKYFLIDKTEYKTLYNTQYKRKKWAVCFAKSKLDDRRELLDRFESLQKRDDVADVIVMGYSLFYD